VQFDPTTENPTTAPETSSPETLPSKPRAPIVHQLVIPIETKSRMTLLGSLVAILNLSQAILDSLAWIKQAADLLLRTAPSWSRTKTARQLEPEMQGAYRRREVDTYLSWNSIRTILTTHNWGPVKKPKRRAAPEVTRRLDPLLTNLNTERPSVGFGEPQGASGPPPKLTHQ
jgi:hypothetical protein